MTREELEAQGYFFIENNIIFSVHRTVRGVRRNTGSILVLAQSHFGLTSQKIEEISCEAATLHFVRTCLDGEENDT